MRHLFLMLFVGVFVQTVNAQITEELCKPDSLAIMIFDFLDNIVEEQMDRRDIKYDEDSSELTYLGEIEHRDVTGDSYLAPTFKYNFVTKRGSKIEMKAFSYMEWNDLPFETRVKEVYDSEGFPIGKECILSAGRTIFYDFYNTTLDRYIGQAIVSPHVKNIPIIE